MSPLEAAYALTEPRFSRQRNLVVRLLAQATDHPTVDELHKRAREHHRNISKPTVLRTLSTLVRIGLAASFETRSGMYRYEDATVGPHGHLIDAETGDIVNFSDSALEAAIDEVARDLGYRRTTYDLFLSAVRIPA